MNIEWRRQEIILLFYVVCTYPVERFILEKDDSSTVVNEFAGLLQKPPAMVFKKLQHLIYLNSGGSQGKWSGGTRVDREIFEEFSEDKERLYFIATKIREDLLSNSPDYIDIYRNFSEAEANEIERLKKIDWKTVGVGKYKPSIQYRTIRQQNRAPTVSAGAKLRASFHCEIIGCNYEPFTGLYELPYIEVHHIERLADGGEDSLENVACLCPKHHREIHFGSNKEKLREAILRKRNDEVDEVKEE